MRRVLVLVVLIAVAKALLSSDDPRRNRLPIKLRRRPLKSRQRPASVARRLALMGGYGQIVGSITGVFGVFFFTIGLAFVALLELVVRATTLVSGNPVTGQTYQLIDDLVRELGRVAWYALDGKLAHWYDVLTGVIIVGGLSIVAVIGGCIGILWNSIMDRQPQAFRAAKVTFAFIFVLLGALLSIPAVFVGASFSAAAPNPSAFFVALAFLWATTLLCAWPFRPAFFHQITGIKLLMIAAIAAAVVWFLVYMAAAISADLFLDAIYAAVPVALVISFFHTRRRADAVQKATIDQSKTTRPT